MEIKGTGKRLVPKRDIDYLKELKENHSDPSASWGGTEVVANPTPGVDDQALTGLQVGENKYAVGEKLYLHRIAFSYLSYNCYYEFIDNESNPYSKENLVSTYGGPQHVWPVSCDFQSSKLAYKCYCQNSNPNNIYIILLSNSFTEEYQFVSSMTDTVTLINGNNNNRNIRTTYFYSENDNSYGIVKNFELKSTPKGFKQITEKKFNDDMKKLEEKGTEEVPEGEK